MITLRDLIWRYIYRSDLPVSLSWKEVLASLVIALLLLGLYWIFQKIFFYYVNDDARHSRVGAFVFAGFLSFGWLLASLDLLGLWSSIVALILVTFAIFADFIYLLVTRT